MFIRILEHSGVLLLAAIGFFVGLFALLIGDLAGYNNWIVALAIVLIAAAALLVLELFDRAFDKGLGRISSWLTSGVQHSEASEARERKFRRAGWLAFFGGSFVAFIAGSIVPPEKIMEYF